MKVYIQKPWKTSDSPYYKSLRESPPEGIKYFNLSKNNLVQSSTKMNSLHKVKSLLKKSIKIFWPSMPNLHFTKSANSYDLIHCAHCLSMNDYPWICNMEYAGQFWASPMSYGTYGNKKIIKKYIESKNCKKIVCWTNWVKQDISKLFPTIKNKLEVVYPGIEKRTFKKKSDSKIKLLFVSRRFYFKGGLYAVETMDRLTKKYNNVEAVIVSDVPKEILDKYSKNKKIKFFSMVPQDKLFKEIYPSSDIFVYPSFTDTFGFPITEAMSFGLPVVSVEGQSRKELIEDGVTGLIAKTKFKGSIKSEWLENLDEFTLGNIITKTEELISNKKLRNKMSKNALKLFEKDGKFSIESRNKKFKKIYGDAVKS